MPLERQERERFLCAGCEWERGHPQGLGICRILQQLQASPLSLARLGGIAGGLARVSLVLSLCSIFANSGLQRMAPCLCLWSLLWREMGHKQRLEVVGSHCAFTWPF